MMNKDMITSTSNKQVKYMKALLGSTKERASSGCFAAEGWRMVSETPAERIRLLLLSERFASGKTAQESLLIRELSPDRVFVVSDRVFDAISDTRTPQGIMAAVEMEKRSPEELLRAENALLVFLENLQDPGNLGTIVRTAECAGATGIIMSRGTADIYNPKTVRSTMGSLYRMPFAYTEDLPGVIRQARQQGIRVFAAHLEASENYTDKDYTGSCGFVIGNEGRGLTEETASAAEERIFIPMAGQAESLNAAVSAAILMYEALRQRS